MKIAHEVVNCLSSFAWHFSDVRAEYYNAAINWRYAVDRMPVDHRVPLGLAAKVDLERCARDLASLWLSWRRQLVAALCSMRLIRRKKCLCRKAVMYAVLIKSCAGCHPSNS